MSVKFYKKIKKYVTKKRPSALRREPFLYVLAIPFISKR